MLPRRLGAAVPSAPDAQRPVQATGKGSAWVRLLQKAFTAATHKKGLEQARGIVATYRDQFPEAMKCLATDLEEVLTALRLSPFADSGCQQVGQKTNGEDS